MYVDVQVRQLNKHHEELCGDAIGWHRGRGDTVLVLADGLGSGVKANILSTLTQKIALTMFQQHMPVHDVVETLAATLPTCQTRNLAYSTFTIIRIADNGETDLVEFDNPPVFVFKDGVLEEIEREERKIGEITLQQAHFTLNEGDFLVAVSDGVMHAGIGGVEPLGWRWEQVADYIQGFIWQNHEAEEIAENVIGAAHGLYRDNVGDDTSVVVMKCRQFRHVTLAVGPPGKPEQDEAMVERLMRDAETTKIVCGGTTAKIVSRVTGTPLTVELNSGSRDLPPQGKIDGIDLVTEGVITIMHTIDALENVRLRKPRVNMHDLNYLYGKQNYRGLLRDAGRRPADPPPTVDNPAETLARHLRLADKVTILLGTALNPAHQNPDLPVHLGLKFHLVDHLAEKLRAREKQVEVIRY